MNKRKQARQQRAYDRAIINIFRFTYDPSLPDPDKEYREKRLNNAIQQRDNLRKKGFQ